MCIRDRYEYIAGFEDFISDLKEHGVKCAVVTSSNIQKMLNVYERHPEFKEMCIRDSTNNMEYEALTISELYRERWNVELYFKWIKQHLHIKSFYGTSENACLLYTSVIIYKVIRYAPPFRE